MISAIAPVYFTGNWNGYEYKDEFVATAGLDITLDAIAHVLSSYEDSLTKGSFALLVDTNTFNVVALSQSVVDKIYPPTKDGKPVLVSDTLSWSLLDGLASANWGYLRHTVLMNDRGERGHTTNELDVDQPDSS
jgi:hypothetical protein